MQNAQAVVTGATGFIGRWLVRALLERGQTVRVVVRNPEAARTLFPRQVEIHQARLEEDAGWKPALVGAETVYHTAGLYTFGWGHTPRLRAANVSGTRRVLQAAWENKAGRFVHLSSAGILKSPSGGLIAEKDFPKAPAFGCAYKASKWHAENIALEFAARGFPVVIANTTCPIGPEDVRPTPTGRMILDHLRGDFTCTVRTGLNFLDVRDLAEGMIAAGERGTTGERYIIGGKNLWLHEFLNKLSTITGIPSPKWTVPWPLLAALSFAGEAGHLLHPHSSRRLCLETAMQARRQQFFDIQRARDELGWQATTPIDNSLREACAWFATEIPGLLPEGLPEEL